MIKTYGAATRLLGPLTPFWIRHRAKAGKEDPERMEERHGTASRERPNGPLIWCHGASVGECTMLLPLIDRILKERKDVHILVTSGTLTSALLLAERLPERAFHQYVPLDYPKAVDKFLDHWKPDFALWAESEIWPNLIRLTKQSGCKMALINARMSEKSLQGWQKRGGKAAKAIFGHFDDILAADDRTANGLSWILGRDIERVGNLKDAAPALPVRADELGFFKKCLGDRPVWCAASTHKGEDEFMFAAHKKVLEKHPDALLILAPRHPERSAKLSEALSLAKIPHVSRTLNDPLTPKTAIFLIDTIGDMGLAYRLSDITFVAGSMIDGMAGHNPLEPARLGNAVLTGPFVSSFAETYMEMISFNAAQRILSPEPIGDMIAEMFSNPENLSHFQKRAQDYANSRNALLDYVWDRLEPLMPEPMA